MVYQGSEVVLEVGGSCCFPKRLAGPSKAVLTLTVAHGCKPWQGLSLL